MEYSTLGGKLLVVDLASTLFFLALLRLTHNTIVSISLGMALGLIQIGTRFVRRKPIGAVGWLSLVLIIAAGFRDAADQCLRFVLFKLSVLYAIAGVDKKSNRKQAISESPFARSALITIGEKPSVGALVVPPQPADHRQVR